MHAKILILLPILNLVSNLNIDSLYNTNNKEFIETNMENKITYSSKVSFHETVNKGYFKNRLFAKPTVNEIITKKRKFSKMRKIQKFFNDKVETQKNLITSLFSPSKRRAFTPKSRKRRKVSAPIHIKIPENSTGVLLKLPKLHLDERFEIIEETVKVTNTRGSSVNDEAEKSGAKKMNGEKSLLAIQRVSGTLSLKQGKKLDYETMDRIRLTVFVTRSTDSFCELSSQVHYRCIIKHSSQNYFCCFQWL